MKKQLLTVALLLSANTVVQASERLPEGKFSESDMGSEPVASIQPVYIVSSPSNPIPQPENPSEGTIYRQLYGSGNFKESCYRDGKWTLLNYSPGLPIDYLKPTSSNSEHQELVRNVQELVRNVQEILKIGTELRDRK
jgi:hypothetical protein